jgi:hypothetical protein
VKAVILAGRLGIRTSEESSIKQVVKSAAGRSDPDSCGLDPILWSKTHLLGLGALQLPRFRATRSARDKIHRCLVNRAWKAKANLGAQLVRPATCHQ